MKKIITLILTVCLCLSLAACGGNDSEESSNIYDGGSAPIVDDASREGIGVFDELSTPNSLTIYLPDAEFLYFDTVTVPFEGDGIALVETMVENGALPQGIKANSFVTVGMEAHIDMNEAYVDYVGSGTTAEYFGIGCLVNTIIKHFPLVESVVITVNDEYIETGHMGKLDFAIGFYEE